MNKMPPVGKIRYCWVVLLIGSALQAQTSRENPTDAQGWYSAKINTAIDDRWKADLEIQVRFFNNLKTYNGTYISVGVERRINEQIALLAEYRLASVQKGIYNRLSGGGTYTREWDRPEFEFRLLFQNQLQDFDEVGKLSQREVYARTRFRLKYPLTDNLEIYGSVEPIFKYQGRQLVDNLRNQAGLRFRLARSLRADLFYIYRPDYAKSYRRTFHVVGLEISYSLKRQKRIC